jgi:hypothetical protein
MRFRIFSNRGKKLESGKTTYYTSGNVATETLKAS